MSKRGKTQVRDVPETGGAAAPRAGAGEDTLSEDDLMDAIDAAILSDDGDGAAKGRHAASMPAERETGDRASARNTVEMRGREAVATEPSVAAPAAETGDAADGTARATPTRLSPEHAIELLSKVNIFAGLPRVYLKRIASLCEEEAYQTGKVLFREGAAGDKLYLILEGAVRISRQVPGMGEEALAVLKAGNYFGEMALIDDFPRSADACVHDSCRLIVIGKEKLQDLLFVDRDLAYDLLWTFVRTLSGRLRQTNDKMTFMAVTSKF